MTDPSPEVVAAALALAEATNRYFGKAIHSDLANELRAYRAAIAPKLRTRAEVDAEIALEVRRSVTGLPCDDCLCPEAGLDNTRAERIRALCREPTAPEPDPVCACPDQTNHERGCRFFSFGPGEFSRPPLEDPVDSCGCEASDALRERLANIKTEIDLWARGKKVALDAFSAIVRLAEEP